MVPHLRGQVKLIGVLLLGALILAGCAQPATQTSPTTKPTQTPTGTTTTPPTSKTQTPTGPYGTLKVGLGSFGEERFDPIPSSQTDITTVVAPMSDYMFMTSGRDLAPGLVEKWEMAADGKSWLFTLDKDAKWHDGTPVTTKDVEWNLTRMTGTEPIYAYVRDSINGQFEVIDNLNIRVFTKGPQPYLPWFLSIGTANQGLLTPKDYYEKNGKDYYQQKPIGNGPFKFLKHVPGDTIEYEALTQHYRQVPAFKYLNLIMVPEETTRIAMLKTGAIDISDIGIEGASDVESAGFKLSNLSISADYVLIHGVYGPKKDTVPTGDIRVRQALSYAINRDEIRATLMKSSLTPTPAFYTWNVADVDIDYWKDYVAKAWAYDPEKAKQLLKDAGYANGFDIKIYSFTMGGSPYLPDLVEVVQGYWKAIGVNAQIVPTDWGTFKSMRAGGAKKEPVDALIGQASVMAASESPIAPMKMVSGWQSGATWNLFSNAKPEVDKYLLDSLSELDQAKRQDLIAKATKEIVDSYTAMGLEDTPLMAAIGNKVDIDYPPLTLAIPCHLDLVKHK